jgi:hypothetical protein
VPIQVDGLHCADEHETEHRDADNRPVGMRDDGRDDDAEAIVL